MARHRTPETVAAKREVRAALTDPAPVMEAAAGFLAARPRSVAETRRRLRHLGYPVALVDQVVERLVEMTYLDDADFAQQWVASRDRARPRGEAALRRELALKGVAREIVDEVLAERATAAGATSAPDVGAAFRLLERRRTALEREPEARRRRQKAYALLARSGFDADVAREASTAFVAAEIEA